MTKTNVKIAWRNLTRNRSHAFINLLGLAIGIACCLLIILWVVDEWRYDRWHTKADRTYRVTSEVKFGGSHQHFAVSPAPLSAALVNDFPEVETAMRFRDYGSALVKHGTQHYKESNILFADSSVFDVFSLEIIKGDRERALAKPNAVVVNERTARKYFPNDDPIGQKLTFDDREEYFVSAVMTDMPGQSHFQADLLVSLKGVKESEEQVWVSHNFHTYYVLREGADVGAFEAKLFPHLVEKYISPQVEKIMGMPFSELEKSGSFVKYHYQPLTDIHLHSDLMVELGANGSSRYVWIFLMAAFFILLIACVNFMNLSTARSTMRAKEIGVRKVMGSGRIRLIGQFLVEAVLMTGMAFVVGLLLTTLVLPSYNVLADKQLSIPFSSPAFWGISFLMVAVVGLIAGSYPAFYLSSFRPIKTLAGHFFRKGGNLNLRNSLVVFQFMIATLLIIATFVVNQQVHFIQNKNLGYDRQQILILDNADPLNEKAFTLKKELLKHPQIETVTVSGYLPTPSYRSDSPLCKSQEFQEDNCVAIQMWQVDEDYIPAFGMELAVGRNFSSNMPTDSNAVIINERAAKLLGFADPIGRKVYRGKGQDDSGGIAMEEATIIGVVKDFHFENLRQNIGALSLWLNPAPGFISMKITTDDLPTLIASVERDWKAVAPGQPFSHRFMDESFDQIYRSEMRISRIFSVFSWLSIIVACLGLFGLAAFTTERRIREIGIRKVLGATTTGLVRLLSQDFLKWVLVALILAMPIAWYFTDRWLEDFAYRVALPWQTFALTACLVIIIAFITVSFQSVRAALADPAESLKSE